MADFQIGNPHGVQKVDGDNRSGAYENENLVSIDAMKTRLEAVDSDYYTDARLDNMTFNDLVYAVRLADDPETVR